MPEEQHRHQDRRQEPEEDGKLLPDRANFPGVGRPHRFFAEWHARRPVGQTAALPADVPVTLNACAARRADPGRLALGLPRECCGEHLPCTLGVSRGNVHDHSADCVAILPEPTEEVGIPNRRTNAFFGQHDAHEVSMCHIETGSKSHEGARRQALIGRVPILLVKVHQCPLSQHAHSRPTADR